MSSIVLMGCARRGCRRFSLGCLVYLSSGYRSKSLRQAANRAIHKTLRECDGIGSFARVAPLKWTAAYPLIASVPAECRRR